MTSPSWPDPAWQRLGEMLIKRRVDIDARYRNRRTFSADTNTDYRVISDIESARRTNFGAPMISHLEAAYRLKAGNIKRIVQGGDIEPAEPVARVAPVALHAPEAASPGVRVEQRNGGHVTYEVTVESELTMEDAIASLGELTTNERILVGNLQVMGYEPAHVAGAVLLLRRSQPARHAGSDAEMRKKA